MANKAVALYQSVKINGKWTFRKVPEQRLRRLSEGKYHVSWYEGAKKKMEPVGLEPDVARAALTRKERELALIAVGGKIAEPKNKDSIRVSAAVEEYFADLRLREGKDGYGVAKKTIQAYNRRLGLLTEYRPSACLDDID